MGRRFTAVLIAAVVACLFSAPVRSGAEPSGLYRLALLDATRDGRLEELHLRSPALGADTRVRVLLPAGYDEQPGRSWPLLLLLHGGGGSYVDWTDSGDTAQKSAGSTFVIVMPDGGVEGWYSDWFNRGAGGSPRWETYHIDELLPFVESRYRILPGRRAVAGLSMGGWGAMTYASRHQDVFQAAAAFSGADHLDFLGPISELAMAGYELGPHGVTLDGIWGNPATDEVRIRAHDAGDLAANLAHTQVFVRVGDGTSPDPLRDLKSSPGEWFLKIMNEDFAARLEAAGVPLSFVVRPGVHDWPYWQADLAATLPQLEAALAAPRRAPEHFDDVAVEPDFGAWGWTVHMQRAVLEFAWLRNTGRAGFTARGSGTMHVRTAPLYCRGRRYSVTQSRHGKTAIKRPDASGRLSIDVDLGPSHTMQDWTAGAFLARLFLGDGYFATNAVTIGGPDRC